MSIDWTPLADLIETHDRFLITTHVRPDGDALGSEVGMVGLLRQKGKDVRVVNTSRTPPRYDFLDPSGILFEHFGTQVTPAELGDREVAVILDLSAWSQLGDMAGYIGEFAGPRVVIDHHVSQDDLGATFLKDTAAEATGTLIVRAIRALGGKFTPEVATGLLTAIAMDTGWFRHSNTRPETLRTAADLVESGASIERIYRLLFERNTVGRLRLMGEALAGLRTDCRRPDRLRHGHSRRHRADRRDPARHRGPGRFHRESQWRQVGLLFMEQARGGIKMSLRSRDGLDCARLAGGFGGGGHRAAAGAILPEPLAESVERVLAAVREALDAEGTGTHHPLPPADHSKRDLPGL